MNPYANKHDFTGLPGAELVVQALTDLGANILSPEALLLLAAEPRLKPLGIDIPDLTSAPPKSSRTPLYRSLERLHGSDEGYTRYNAMLGRILSFASALEREQSTESALSSSEEQPPCG